MKIKTYLPLLYIIPLCTSIILVSCESHEQKADDAFEYIRQEKVKKDSDLAVIEVVNVEKEKSKPIIQKTQIDEWTKFKNEVEKKIVLNDLQIAELKSSLNASTKFKKRITSLEIENKDLIKKMDEYKEAEKVKWENFKTDINHQVNTIGIDLNDMKSNPN